MVRTTGKAIAVASSAPAVIFVGAKIAELISQKIGLHVDYDTWVTVMTGVYGVGLGMISWFSNRKKKR